VACHDLASLRATGERNPRLLAAGSLGWLRVQGREGALSAPGGGAGLGARSGAADVGFAAEWCWLPSLRGSHLASCVGRRSASRTGQSSTYTASLGSAAEPRLCEREARGVVIVSAKRSDIDIARVNGGGGPRRRAERGGACPPPGQKGLLTFRGEGGVSGACPGESSKPGHPKGRKRRSGWDVGTALKARTRELAFDVGGSGLWAALACRAE
jgi:hypothetical protein